MTAYRLHRLGWTIEEIGNTLGLAKSSTSEICSGFPELENPIKKLLTDGIPHRDVAERFNMPFARALPRPEIPKIAPPRNKKGRASPTFAPATGCRF